MRLQVVAGLFKSRVQRKLLEQAWPGADVLWGVTFEELRDAAPAELHGVILVFMEDVIEDELRDWILAPAAAHARVVLVFPVGSSLPSWVAGALHVYSLHEPLDIHWVKHVLNGETPSPAEG